VKIRLSTRVELSVNLIGQLRAEAVDVVVGNLPITSEGGGLKHLPLPSSAIVALIPPGHRLCGRDVIAPGDLAGEPLILPPGDTCAWFTSVSDMVFEAAGIVPFVVHYTATTNVAARLAAQSMGIALTSQYSIDPQTDRVHVAELAAPRARLQHALFWRERSASKAIEQLVEYMESSPA
jgi:DNA-binding transcriptional LysR family regulator